MKELLKELAIYDWITILYIIVGVACFIWVSTGNEYIFNKIEKKMEKTQNLISEKQNVICIIWKSEKAGYIIKTYGLQ